MRRPVPLALRVDRRARLRGLRLRWERDNDNSDNNNNYYYSSSSGKRRLLRSLRM
jgi:hypothetical protein